MTFSQPTTMQRSRFAQSITANHGPLAFSQAPSTEYYRGPEFSSTTSRRSPRRSSWSYLSRGGKARHMLPRTPRKARELSRLNFARGSHVASFFPAVDGLWLKWLAASWDRGSIEKQPWRGRPWRKRKPLGEAFWGRKDLPRELQALKEEYLALENNPLRRAPGEGLTAHTQRQVERVAQWDAMRERCNAALDIWLRRDRNARLVLGELDRAPIQPLERRFNRAEKKWHTLQQRSARWKAAAGLLRGFARVPGAAPLGPRLLVPHAPEFLSPQRRKKAPRWVAHTLRAQSLRWRGRRWAKRRAIRPVPSFQGRQLLWGRGYFFPKKSFLAAKLRWRLGRTASTLALGHDLRPTTPLLEPSSRIQLGNQLAELSQSPTTAPALFLLQQLTALHGLTRQRQQIWWIRSAKTRAKPARESESSAMLLRRREKLLKLRAKLHRQLNRRKPGQLALSLLRRRDGCDASIDTIQTTLAKRGVTFRDTRPRKGKKWYWRWNHLHPSRGTHIRWSQGVAQVVLANKVTRCWVNNRWQPMTSPARSTRPRRCIHWNLAAHWNASQPKSLAERRRDQRRRLLRKNTALLASLRQFPQTLARFLRRQRRLPSRQFQSHRENWEQLFSQLLQLRSHFGVKQPSFPARRTRRSFKTPGNTQLTSSFHWRRPVPRADSRGMLARHCAGNVALETAPLLFLGQRVPNHGSLGRLAKLLGNWDYYGKSTDAPALASAETLEQHSLLQLPKSEPSRSQLEEINANYRYRLSRLYPFRGHVQREIRYFNMDMNRYRATVAEFSQGHVARKPHRNHRLRDYRTVLATSAGVLPLIGRRFLTLTLQLGAPLRGAPLLLGGRNHQRLHTLRNEGNWSIHFYHGHPRVTENWVYNKAPYAYLYDDGSGEQFSRQTLGRHGRVDLSSLALASANALGRGVGRFNGLGSGRELLLGRRLGRWISRYCLQILLTPRRNNAFCTIMPLRPKNMPGERIFHLSAGQVCHRKGYLRRSAANRRELYGRAAFRLLRHAKKDRRFKFLVIRVKHYYDAVNRVGTRLGERLWRTQSLFRRLLQFQNDYRYPVVAMKLTAGYPSFGGKIGLSPRRKKRLRPAKVRAF